MCARLCLRHPRHFPRQLRKNHGGRRRKIQPHACGRNGQQRDANVRIVAEPSHRVLAILSVNRAIYLDVPHTCPFVSLQIPLQRITKPLHHLAMMREKQQFRSGQRQTFRQLPLAIRNTPRAAAVLRHVLIKVRNLGEGCAGTWGALQLAGCSCTRPGHGLRLHFPPPCVGAILPAAQCLYEPIDNGMDFCQAHTVRAAQPPNCLPVHVQWRGAVAVVAFLCGFPAVFIRSSRRRHDVCCLPAVARRRRLASNAAKRLADVVACDAAVRFLLAYARAVVLAELRVGEGTVPFNDVSRLPCGLLHAVVIGPPKLLIIVHCILAG